MGAMNMTTTRCEHGRFLVSACSDCGRLDRELTRPVDFGVGRGAAPPFVGQRVSGEPTRPVHSNPIAQAVHERVVEEPRRMLEEHARRQARFDREFEMVLDNKKLFSILFITFVLLGVFFAMGYALGRSSAPVESAAGPTQSVPETPASTARPSPRPVQPCQPR